MSKVDELRDMLADTDSAIAVMSTPAEAVAESPSLAATLRSLKKRRRDLLEEIDAATQAAAHVV